jgi:hypothetical protein
VTQKGLEVANALESVHLVERLCEDLMMYVQHKTAVFVIVRGLKSLVSRRLLPLRLLSWLRLLRRLQLRLRRLQLRLRWLLQLAAAAQRVPAAASGVSNGCCDCCRWSAQACLPAPSPTACSRQQQPDACIPGLLCWL